MARSYSITVANAELDAYQTAIGASPQLRFYTGAAPATCATAASGTLLAQMALPATWMAAASARSKSLSGSWTTTGLAAAGTGTTIGYFRIYDSTGTTCHDQGTVTVTGGGGDLTVDNVSLAQNQNITVTSFTLTA